MILKIYPIKDILKLNFYEISKFKLKKNPIFNLLTVDGLTVSTVAMEA